MKRCLTVFSFFILILATATAQDHPIESQIFDEITQLEFSDSGQPVVFTQDGDHLVHILNQNSFEPEIQLVPKGQGPGELQTQHASFLDKKNNRVFMIGPDKRMIGYNFSRKLIYDALIEDLSLGLMNQKNPTMLIKDKYLFISSSPPLMASEKPDEPIPFIQMIDTTTTKVVYEFTMSLDQLAFESYDVVEKANQVILHPELVMINDRLSVLVINGLPYFYFFVNGEFVKRTEIDADFEVEYITSTREEFGDNVGVRTPSNINSVQLIGNDHLLLSYGNIHQEIPVGFSVHRIEHSVQSGLNDEITITKIKDQTLTGFEDLSELNLTYHKGDLFIHNNYDWLAHQIYVIEDLSLGF
ncbi:MAG: hypothetical protein WD357_01255 [Gracilimonas sp.]